MIRLRKHPIQSGTFDPPRVANMDQRKARLYAAGLLKAEFPLIRSCGVKAGVIGSWQVRYFRVWLGSMLCRPVNRSAVIKGK
jgi:hypothetical protein